MADNAPWPPLEYRQKWVKFRQQAAPHHYNRALTVSATQLRDVIIAALWNTECSYDQAQMAINAAVNQLITDGAWGPPRPDMER